MELNEMVLTLEVENVAGFVGKKVFSGIKPGLNRIRAPNAAGKTSLIKALELLVLSENELSNKGHYSNLYVGSEEQTAVKLKGDIEHERRFRRVGMDSLHLIDGEPLLGYDSKQVLSACFAVPWNTLINDIRHGKPIREYVRIFAGSENYDKILSILSDISYNTAAKIQQYRETQVRVQEMEKLKAELQEELKVKRKKLAQMPPLDDRAIFEDYELYIKKSQELRKKTEEITKVRSHLADLTENINQLKEEIRILDARIEAIKRRHPKLESRLNELAELIPKKEQELKKVRIQKAKAEEKLASAQRNEIILQKYGENICYACGKEMTKEELQEWLEKIRMEIDDLKEIHKKLNRELEDLKDEQQRLEREFEELGNAQRQLTQRQKSLANREAEKREREKSLKMLERERKDLMEEIAML